MYLFFSEGKTMMSIFTAIINIFSKGGERSAVISLLFVLSRVDRATIHSEMTKVRKHLLLAGACYL